MNKEEQETKDSKRIFLTHGLVLLLGHITGIITLQISLNWAIFTGWIGLIVALMFSMILKPRKRD